MSCSTHREHFDALADGTLPADRIPAVRAHLDVCGACARHYDQLRSTIALLRRLGPSTLPPERAAQLSARLRTVRPLGHVEQAPEGARLAGFSSTRWAFAGGLAILGTASLLGVGWHRHIHRPEAASSAVVLAPAGPVAPVFVVPSERVAVVRIDFHADVRVEDVEFAIHLPDGLSFVSEGRELPDRVFRWKGRLERGSNTIPVAVRGSRAGRYTLRAHADGPRLNARHEVVLEVVS